MISQRNLLLWDCRACCAAHNDSNRLLDSKFLLTNTIKKPALFNLYAQDDERHLLRACHRLTRVGSVGSSGTISSGLESIYIIGRIAL
jgi:hypothetical protein